MQQIDIAVAANLIRSAYAQAIPNTRARYIGAGVLAHLQVDGTLLVPGTDELGDWFSFNLPTERVLGQEVGFPAGSAVGRAPWYRGFAVFAGQLAKAMGPTRPRMVIGHSLGGAAAQILAVHFGVPAVTFSAPQPALSPEPLPGEALVLNVVYPGDPVTRFPLSVNGSRRLGRTHSLPRLSSSRFVHSINSLADLLNADLASGRLARRWPAAGASSSRGPIRSGGARVRPPAPS